MQMKGFRYFLDSIYARKKIHTPSNMKINDKPFLCNPIGYINENANIDFNKTIILE